MGLQPDIKKLCRAGRVDNRQKGLVGRGNNVSRDTKVGVGGGPIVEKVIPQLTFIRCLPFARCCSKYLIYIGPFIPYNDTTKQVFWLFLFCFISEATGAQKGYDIVPGHTA